jgi:N-acetyl-beta-hexosaminidase
MAFRPTADQIKQPDRPKLADIMGPGLITGASDDDPSGIAIFASRRTVRVLPGLDTPAHLPAHVRNPNDQRSGGSRYW